jgi:hypothetical protein
MTKVQTYRCDRCGKVFSKDEDSLQSQVTIHDHDIIWDRSVEDNTGDICADCVDSYYKWMEHSEETDKFFELKFKNTEQEDKK